MLPAVLCIGTKWGTSIPTKDIAITEAPGNETLDHNNKLESSRKPLLQSPSQPIHYFQHHFLSSMEGSSSEKAQNILLALTSLWETMHLSNLSFLLCFCQAIHRTPWLYIEYYSYWQHTTKTKQAGIITAAIGKVAGLMFLNHQH